MASQRRGPQKDSSTVVVDWLKSLNNLSGYEFLFMRYSATGFVPATAGEKVFGVLANGGAASAIQVTVHSFGKSQLKVNEACSAGERLVADGSGAGVVTATDNEDLGAIALADVSAAGQIIPVMVVAGLRQ